MTPGQGTFANLFIAVVAIWAVGLGTLMTVGKHGWYMSATKRIINKIWTKNKTRIVWMLVGGILTFWLMSP